MMAGEARLKPVRDGEAEDDKPMRSFAGRGLIVPPEPNYDEGEKAFIEHDDPKQGKKFLVIIASPGQWNDRKQQVEYRLKLKDGMWYKNGEWVEEKCLNAK